MCVKHTLLTRLEAADYLRIQPQTLAVWAVAGKNLPYVKIGRSVRYRLSDLEKYIAKRTIAANA
jgi:excisionase family DNA binding protein